MPLDDIQHAILRLLAANRDAESYVAGSTPLNVHAARYSSDIDLFHDREERVARAAQEDGAVLLAHGYDLRWLRREPAIHAALVAKGKAATRLEWVADSDFRFFPAEPDELFGFRLHPADLATNKIMAAAGRREPRDLVDLLTIHRTVLPLGAVAWAAVGKALGFTPEALLDEVRRTRYAASDFSRLASDPPVDPAATMVALREALDEAAAFVASMPTEAAGLLFLQDGMPVQPDPAGLAAFQRHAGRRRGHWPDSPGLAAAMLGRGKTNGTP